MKKILLFGDSVTWGVVPGPDSFRYEKKDRIGGILQDLLGNNFEVIEEGRPGRTIASNDNYVSKNGAIAFENAVASHQPLDYIFIMLGTNDIKKKFNFDDADEIAAGFLKYKEVINNFNKSWEANFNPKVVIIAPPKIEEKFLSKDYQNSEEFAGREKISSELSFAYQKMVEENKFLDYDFIDASHVKVSEGDGVHLEVEQNKEIADLIFNHIKKYENI